jgi:hypothetical protein
MVEGGIDHRCDRDLVDALYGLVVEGNGETEVSLHPR